MCVCVCVCVGGGGVWGVCVGGGGGRHSVVCKFDFMIDMI